MSNVALIYLLLLSADGGARKMETVYSGTTMCVPSHLCLNINGIYIYIYLRGLRIKHS